MATASSIVGIGLDSSFFLSVPLSIVRLFLVFAYSSGLFVYLFQILNDLLRTSICLGFERGVKNNNLITGSKIYFRLQSCYAL